MNSDRPFELKTDTGKVLRWNGRDGLDASRRCAEAKQVTIVAFREPRVTLLVGGPTDEV